MSFQVEFAGTKYKASATPMQPLRVLVEQVCSQLKVAVDPSSCELHHGRSKLNLADPVRFANVPRGVVLHMTSNQPDAPRLGLAHHTAASASASSAEAATRAPASARGPAAPPAAPATAADTAPLIPPPHTPQAPVSEASGPPQAPPNVEIGSSVRAQDEGASTSSATTGDGQAKARDSAALLHAPPVGWNGLGKRPAASPQELEAEARKRSYKVFSRNALTATQRQEGMVDESDAFFELTAADIHRELATQKRKQAHAEAGLRTRARRDQESAAKAAAIGHATIRLVLPFGIIVQSDFSPLDTLDRLAAFVKYAVLKSDFAACFSLFTTPPKRTLSSRDMELNFWDAGLVPGAYVHVSIDHDILTEGVHLQQSSQEHIYRQFLRSEVLSAESSEAPAQRSTESQQQEDSNDTPKRGGAEFAAAKSSKVPASGGKVPKWFKMGK